MGKKTKAAPLKYRLALKLDRADQSAATGYGKAALACAVVKLGGTKAHFVRSYESSELPAPLAPNEVTLLVYDDTAEMLEPMTKEQFDARLAQVEEQLEPGYSIRKVRFRKAEYDEWRGKRRDTHRLRAEWAGQQ